MSLLEMSFSASVIIIVVIVFRLLWIHKLPKKVFLILWLVALLRLLVPFSIPSIFSIYSVLSQNSFIMNQIEDTSFINFLPFGSREQELDKIPADEKRTKEVSKNSGKAVVEAEQGQGQEKKDVQSEENGKQAIESNHEQNALKENTMHLSYKQGNISVWMVVWGIGMSLCIIIYSVIYIICYRQFRISFPVENEFLKEWFLLHKTGRKISVRQSDCINAPLSYGFIHPVILMPKATKWENAIHLEYVLEHELIHIQRLDAVIKFFLIVAVCVHWFNPLAWVMYFLVNRDIELSCDEAVIRHFGKRSRTAYALSLIQMEEMKSVFVPLGNNFGTNKMEERITAIMKIQNPSVFTNIWAVSLIICVIAAFATSAFDQIEQGADTVTEAESVTQYTSFLSGRRDEASLLPQENGQGLWKADFQKEKQPESLLSAINTDMETGLPKEQQIELFNEYRKHDVYKDGNILYYQGKPIRCFIDKYQEETINAIGGRNINTIRVYTYFNEMGMVDVSAVREYKKGKTKVEEVIRDSIDMVEMEPVAVEQIIIDLPRKSRNKLAQKAAREGRYDSLEEMVRFVDARVLEEIAEGMVEQGVPINGIADYISRYILGKLAEEGYKKWGFSFIRELLPLLPQGSLYDIANMAAEEKDYDGRKELIEFIDKNS